MTGDGASFAGPPPLVAVGLMVFAVLSFTVLDSIAKWLSADTPLVQLVWGRYFFSLMFMLAVVPKMGIAALCRTTRPGFQVARAIMLLGATGSMFLAVKFLTLTETYSITFVSPFIVALAAMLLLGESVDWRRWLAIAGGFIGVLVVMRPGAEAFSWAAIFPLMMASFWAAYQIMTRMIGGSEQPLTTLFYTSLVGTLIASIAVVFFWQPAAAGVWLGMVAMGFIGFLGQLALIRAYAMAPASLLSPLVYTQIVWASLIGFSLFGDLPDSQTMIGSGIIVASGLALLVWRGRT